MIFIN
jgi:mitochondrial GTPase 1